ncbi:hypothetical protein MMC20_004222 [Loxospora ochrophaea]|nr:hypothetical protein [Loxospora ochrophaea]
MSSSWDPSKESNKFFDAVAATYDRFAGSCMRQVSRHSLTLIPPLHPEAHVLDNACGTALLTRTLLDVYPRVQVNAVDLSPGMIENVQGLISARGWNGQVEASIMDGNELTFQDDAFDVSFTLFGIFFFPDKGANEIYRTLKPGGHAIVTTWENLGWLPLMHAVQEMIEEDAAPFSVSAWSEWSSKDKVEQTLRRGGFGNVQVSRYPALVTGTDLDDLIARLQESWSNIRKDVWGAPEEQVKVRKAMKQVLEANMDKYIVEGDNGMPGVRMDAWVAVAAKQTMHKETNPWRRPDQ